MKKLILGLGISALVLGVAGTAAAYQGNPKVQGPNYSPERHEAMVKALENKDYVAWQNLMQGRGRVTQVINQDNFAKFAEAHQLAMQGKLVEAQKIRQELGLGSHSGSGKAMNGTGFSRGFNR